MTNIEIARKLQEHAAELAQERHNLYRVRAFRQAAFAVLGLPQEVTDVIAAFGPAGLQGVPGIGNSLAETIANYAQRGEWNPRTPLRRTRRMAKAG
jgi:DNA polymerase/3'-5' exonuclease PolX